MSDGVPSHGAHFALIQRVVHRGPVDEAGLGLDDPEILALEAAGEVMGGALATGIHGALADAVAPGGKVEVVGDGVVIESVEPAHGIGSDELAAIGIGANGIHLILLVTAPGVADEAS